jgi:hypothetical protein
MGLCETEKKTRNGERKINNRVYCTLVCLRLFGRMKRNNKKLQLYLFGLRPRAAAEYLFHSPQHIDVDVIQTFAELGVEKDERVGVGLEYDSFQFSYPQMGVVDDDDDDDYARLTVVC